MPFYFFLYFRFFAKIFAHKRSSPFYLEHLNSVDGLQANPTNPKEFTSASHDKTIKIWDATKFTPKVTLTGHESGVWCVNYNKKNSSQIITSSADFTARIWDIKSGKNTLTLKGHTHYVYKACFDSDGDFVATCGADKIVNYWDPRNPSKPVFTIGDCHNVLLSCDFMPNCQQILVTSMEGEIMMVSVKRQMSIFMHDTLPAIKEERKKLLEANNLDGNKEKEIKEIDLLSN